MAKTIEYRNLSELRDAERRARKAMNDAMTALQAARNQANLCQSKAFQRIVLDGRTNEVLGEVLKRYESAGFRVDDRLAAWSKDNDGRPWWLDVRDGGLVRWFDEAFYGAHAGRGNEVDQSPIKKPDFSEKRPPTPEQLEMLEVKFTDAQVRHADLAETLENWDGPEGEPEKGSGWLWLHEQSKPLNGRSYDRFQEIPLAEWNQLDRALRLKLVRLDMVGQDLDV